MHTTKVIMNKFSYFKALTLLALALFVQSATAQVTQRSGHGPQEITEMASLALPGAPMPDLRDPNAANAIEPAFIAPVVAVKPLDTATPAHRFWDRENSILFAATASTATADFFVTHRNLSAGGRELNPLVRPLAGSTAGLATNFAVETAGVMAISYVFHKTGHHRLERLTSLTNIGASTVAVTYGILHR